MATTLDINTLESWLWECACKIRGEIDAPKYKDYILPLIFIKRLSDVFEDELIRISKDYGGKLLVAENLLKEDHSLVRFYVPKEARWETIALQTTNVGQYLTDSVRTIAKENPKLHDVIDIVDFNATAQGERIISNDSLCTLFNILKRYRLGLNDVEPDLFGRAYEYMLRKFAEGSGQSAGEFYTPSEVALLMAHIINPEPGQTCYDPCAGSGGLLIKCHLNFTEKYKGDTKTAPLKYFGQERLPATLAMAKMNSFIHDMEADIVPGDTMRNPKFIEEDGSLRKFDVVTANPMWNQDFEQKVYEDDTYNRFGFGYPPSNTADWGWIQHMYTSLNDKGKMAIVLDTGAVSRGSGNAGKNKERDIRKEFVEKDLVEAVILLPENLFYNTTAPGIILVINKGKSKKQKDTVLLINASHLFKKGKPKNFLPEENIKKIAGLYLKRKEEEGICRIIPKEDIVRNDYNLSPSRYVAPDNEDDTLPLEDAVVLLREAEEERREADEKLNAVLKTLGF